MIGVTLSAGTTIVSFIIPAYASVKALQSNDVLLLRPWLRYWVVFGCLAVVEHYDFLLCRILPFYSLIRLAVYTWLIHPQTRGSEFVYTQYVAPFVQQHEGTVLQLLRQVYADGGSAMYSKVLSLLNSVLAMAGLRPAQSAAVPLSASKSKPNKYGGLGAQRTDTRAVAQYISNFLASYRENDTGPELQVPGGSFLSGMLHTLVPGSSRPGSRAPSGTATPLEVPGGDKSRRAFSAASAKSRVVSGTVAEDDGEFDVVKKDELDLSDADEYSTLMSPGKSNRRASSPSWFSWKRKGD